MIADLHQEKTSVRSLRATCDTSQKKERVTGYV